MLVKTSGAPAAGGSMFISTALDDSAPWAGSVCDTEAVACGISCAVVDVGSSAGVVMVGRINPACAT